MKTKPFIAQRVCDNPDCGKLFLPKNRNQRFCATDCGQKAYCFDGGRPKLASSTTGAISELHAANDLLMRGYEVFRALSPACSCDLIALKNDIPLRIEVRTGNINRITGNLSFARNGEGIRLNRSTKNKRSETDLDHYAVVYWEDGKPNICYEPELPE